MRSPRDANIFELQREMENLHGFGVYILDSPISALIAEVQIASGDFVGADATLGMALDFVDRTQELYWLPELHRLRGRVAVEQGNADLAARCLSEAVRVARGQEAICLELRASNDLAEHSRASLGPDIFRTRVPELLAIVDDERSIDVQRAQQLAVGRSPQDSKQA
jgi:predicted ATPase